MDRQFVKPDGTCDFVKYREVKELEDRQGAYLRIAKQASHLFPEEKRREPLQKDE